jgi:D-lactate dehydrogenase
MSFEYEAVFYEAFEEEQDTLKRVLPPGHKYLFTWKAIQESGHKINPAPIISTRTQSVFPAEWAPNIKAIITRSTGYDHVSAYLRKTDAKIDAAYLPEYAARAVAEQALMMWTGLLRNINIQRGAFRTFHRDGLTGREIKGRTILVIGVGRIGSQIVDIASGLGMKTLGVDIKPNPELVKKYNLSYVSMAEGLPRADIVVCALPLTHITNKSLNYGTLGSMRRGTVFINIARGEISPVPDLARLLDEGIISGLGLDVYDYERELAAVLRGGAEPSSFPPDAEESIKAVQKLAADPRVIMTPHNAFNTEESVERKSINTAENLDSYFKTGAFLTPVPEPEPQPAGL